MDRHSWPEMELWARATRANLLGIDVLVPSPTDRLVNAIAAEIMLPSGIATDDVWIEARQSGILSPGHSADEGARYAPRPFRVTMG